MSEIKKQWYVVRAIGGKEGKVKEYIEAEIRHNHLEDYISQVLIPNRKIYTIRQRKEGLQGEGLLSGLRAWWRLRSRADSDIIHELPTTCLGFRDEQRTKARRLKNVRPTRYRPSSTRPEVREVRPYVRPTGRRTNVHDDEDGRLTETNR